MNEQLPKEETVTVCADCLKASCWQGEFYCDDYKSAGTVEKTMTELLELDREHWSYWSPS
jgi:hypothetical protein